MQRDPLARVGDDVTGEQPGDDLEGVLQQVEALCRRRERDPEFLVFLLEPGCAERQLEPTVGRVVDRHGLGRQHGRVPVGGPGDEQAEPDPRGQP